MVTFRFNSEDFSSRLSYVSRVVNPKASIPALSNVLFEIKGQTLYLVGGDTENWIRGEVPINDSSEDFSFCVRNEDLTKFFFALGSEQVEASLDKSTITFKYKNGVCSMSFVGAEEYPLPQMDDDIEKWDFAFRVDAKMLSYGMEKNIGSCSTDTLRPIMTGIYFDFKEQGVNVVASDGYELSLLEIEEGVYEVLKGDAMKFVLPSRAAQLLISIMQKTDKKAIVMLNSQNLCVSCDNFVLSTRLIEGCYPNYQSIIPQTSPISIVESKSTFISALKRVCAMSEVSTNLVILTLSDGKINLKGEDVDFNHFVSEDIPTDYKGEAVEMGFKGQKLLSIIQNVEGEDMVMSFMNNQRPCLVSPQNNLEKCTQKAILMPMMLNR